MTGVSRSKMDRIAALEAGEGKIRLKKAYRLPVLAKYGAVSKLTAGMTGTRHDPGHGSPTKHGIG